MGKIEIIYKESHQNELFVAVYFILYSTGGVLIRVWASYENVQWVSVYYYTTKVLQNL